MLVTPAFAQTKTFTAKTQFEHQWISPFAIDALNSEFTHGQTGFVRLQLGARHQIGSLTLKLFGDGIFLQPYGPSSDIGLSIGRDTFREPRDNKQIWIPRAVSIDYKSSIGLWSCGMNTLQWGQGVLINDGMARGRFGRVINASTYGRCSFGTQLGKHVQPFISAGAVFRDDQAEWLEGDRAFSIVSGLRWSHAQSKMGLLVAFRTQDDRLDPHHPAGTKTDLTSIISDLTWAHAFHAGHQKVEWVGELALILGHTTRPYLEETFEDGADIRAFGGMTRATFPMNPIKMHLELGYASGDNDPMDDTVRTFNFHSSFGVGLVLVDHVLPMMSARSVDRINDDSLLDVTPPSLRFTVNQGTATGLAYLNPGIEWMPRKDTGLVLHYLYFSATADLVDIYNTQINGGFNTNYSNRQPGSRSLGQEVDLRVKHSIDLWSDAKQPVVLSVLLEGAIFFPGDAFEDVLTKPILAGRTGLHIDF